MESLNRKIKDLRRLAHGFRNFDHLRNRFLFATRRYPTLNGIEKKKFKPEQTLRFRSSVSKQVQMKLLSELRMLKEKRPDITKDELMALKIRTTYATNMV